MIRFRILSSVLASGFLMLGLNTAAQAELMVDITTSPPAAQGSTAAPQGYHNCRWVRGGWRNGYWETAHQICRFHRGNRYWITAHFRCTSYTRNGSCRFWRWIPGQMSYEKRW